MQSGSLNLGVFASKAPTKYWLGSRNANGRYGCFYLAEIHYKPVPARSPDGPHADNSTLNGQIEHLQAELARLEVEKNCLEARVAGHRSDFERERDRCDKLLAETLVLTKVAMSASENAARLEGEVSARRGRRRWGHFFAPRRANAQRPAETSVTASPLPARI